MKKLDWTAEDSLLKSLESGVSGKQAGVEKQVPERGDFWSEEAQK
jgi:hypothetical protein